MTTRPVAVKVSAATRLYGSCSRQASRSASETWSAILSGWPSVTDSEVNKKRSLNFRLLPIQGIVLICPSRKRSSAETPLECKNILQLGRLPLVDGCACTSRLGLWVYFSHGNWAG